MYVNEENMQRFPILSVSWAGGGGCEDLMAWTKRGISDMADQPSPQVSRVIKIILNDITSPWPKII